jgi:hypothetical protein
VTLSLSPLEQAVKRREILNISLFFFFIIEIYLKYFIPTNWKKKNSIPMILFDISVNTLPSISGLQNSSFKNNT